MTNDHNSTHRWKRNKKSKQRGQHNSWHVIMWRVCNQIWLIKTGSLVILLERACTEIPRGFCGWKSLPYLQVNCPFNKCCNKEREQKNAITTFVKQELGINRIMLVLIYNLSQIFQMLCRLRYIRDISQRVNYWE